MRLAAPRSRARPTTPFGVLLNVAFTALAFAIPSAAALGEEPPGADPLAPFLGERVVVEFPPLEDVGRTRTVPAGWRYLQVTTATYDAFARHLDPAVPLALLYFDEHGNLHLRDDSRERLVRIERSAAEAEKRIGAWRRRLARDWNSSQDARRGGKTAEELAILVALRDEGKRGAPELIEALARLREIEGERLGELWRVLASEGLVPRRALLSALEELLARSRGLALEARLRGEIERVERGWVAGEKAGEKPGEKKPPDRSPPG